MEKLHTMNSEALMKLIKTRRSVRKFIKTIPKEEDVLKLIEAARYAPSATNLQPWRFIIVRSEKKKKEMAKVVEEQIKRVSNRFLQDKAKLLKNYLENYIFFKEAPIVIVALYKPYPTVVSQMIMIEDSEINKVAFEQTIAIQSVSAAIQNILLMAHSLGLGGCWMSNPLIARVELEKILSVKKPYKLMAIIPIGIPLQESNPPQRKKVELIMKVVS